jgi:hypothetical protein
MLVSHRIDHENKVIITSFAPEEVTLKLYYRGIFQLQGRDQIPA